MRDESDQINVKVTKESVWERNSKVKVKVRSDKRKESESYREESVR